jgi:hypothetical protein
MKKIFKHSTLLLLLLCVGYAQAQDFTKVDARVKNYPATFADADKFAAKIKADFTREDEKARAIFTWIALNISYDASPAAKGRKPIHFSYKTAAERKAAIIRIENDLANTTLKLKKGVCHGYAMLYTVVAKKAGLETEVVYGAAKSVPADIGKAPAKGNHAWNAVKVNGQWKLLDVTWSAGGMSGNRKFNLSYDDKYFFTQPDAFFLNHFPDDKKWLLTNKTAADFTALPLYYILGYEFIAPVAGTIKKPAAGVIPLKIKGVKASDEIVYQFTSSAFSSRATPKFANGLAEFNVPVGKDAKGNLTIFVNKLAIAAYKIAN